jgi:phosphoribosylaminoimidazolecarboxamide formyltransferase/IMP cyclohydrolase
MIKRALISVSDKTGLIDFARVLAGRKIEIVSTGGTARSLEQAGIPVVPISTLTGFPEMLDGRVKTLQPQIFGGILYLRDNPEHCDTVQEHGIGPIDLVVVNLYPFEATVAKGAPVEEVIENIDIGGPSLIRAAAKNAHDVAVVVDPSDYAQVASEIEASGAVSPVTKLRLMARAYARTAAYDAAIAAWTSDLAVKDGATVREEHPFPGLFSLSGSRVDIMRYGENPHQRAALYRVAESVGPAVVGSRVLQGKALSYNNILDLDAALAAVLDYRHPAVVIVKHNNPCGVAEAATLMEALDAAWACDPVSAYGGVLAFNRPMTKEVASFLSSRFVEAVIAPSYPAESLEILEAKTNLRLLAWDGAVGSRDRLLELRRVAGGFLVQDADSTDPDASLAGAKVVTRRSPSDAEREALAFAWKAVRHVKSNAILFAAPGRSLAIGAGQMSRVDSVRIAIAKATAPLAGSVLASDAFFPFPDGLIAAVEAGATAVVQPGGSVRDGEVIEAANERNVAMIFTGRRHFRH